MHVTVIEGYGGPCGVLAAVQAELLIQCLYRDGNVMIDDSSMRLDERSLQKAFVSTLAAIIERAKGGSSLAIVESTVDIKVDMQNLESSHFRIVILSSAESLISYLSNHIQMFFSDTGCLLFLMSLVFTRSIDTIVSEMDNAEHTLIGISFVQIYLHPMTLERTIRPLQSRVDKSAVNR